MSCTSVRLLNSEKLYITGSATYGHRPCTGSRPLNLRQFLQRAVEIMRNVIIFPLKEFRSGTALCNLSLPCLALPCLSSSRGQGRQATSCYGLAICFVWRTMYYLPFQLPCIVYYTIYHILYSFYIDSESDECRSQSILRIGNLCVCGRRLPILDLHYAIEALIKRWENISQT